MDTRVLTAIEAVVGIPLVLAGYLLISERLLRLVPMHLRKRIRGYVWVGPGVAFATIFMVLPTLNTIQLSFMDRKGVNFVGLDNYSWFFDNPDTMSALKNSLLWLVLFTGFVVIGGTLIAVIFDRVGYETFAKTAVFLPIPISGVAASIIWKLVYQFNAPGTPQTGTLNAMVGAAGFQPIAWLIENTTNNPALIFAGVWTSMGFAVVILSASLKGINRELIEAARVDGANEFQILLMIIRPLLMPTIMVVATTMIINALRVFDIVYVLTAGAYDTNVIAVMLFQEFTQSGGHYGRGSAIGVLLLIAVTPLVFINIRRFQRQEAER